MLLRPGGTIAEHTSVLRSSEGKSNSDDSLIFKNSGCVFLQFLQADGYWEADATALILALGFLCWARLSHSRVTAADFN